MDAFGPDEQCTARLGGRNIRLVKIAPGEPNDDIRCTVEMYNLDAGVKYSALSYVCGTDKAGRPVECDSKPRQITQNLYDALYHLRLRHVEGLLWIDAISINQSDPVEKSSQVAMMRDIFANADQVLAWAGREDDGVLAALELLDKLHAVVKDAPLDFRQAGGDLDLQQHSFPPFKDPAWKALWSFLSRSLFTRVWIVQELVMYRSSITLCGTLSINTDVVLTALSVIRYYGNVFRAREVQVSETVSAVLNNGHVVSLLRRLRLEGFPPQLSDIVSITRYHHATDERDSVFALVGIASDQPVALIDYSDDIRTCTIRYAKYALLKPKEGWVSLDMLSHVSEGRPELHLPSWVPDLRLLTYGFRALGSSFYSSSLDTTQMFRFDGDEGEILVTYGHCFDTVQTAVQSPLALALKPADESQGASRLEAIDNLVTWEEECCEIAMRPSETSSPAPVMQHGTSSPISTASERYWRSLIFDIYQETHPAPPDMETSFMSWRELLLFRKRRLEASKVETSELRRKNEDKNENLLVKAIPFMESLQYYAMGRSFMRTESGCIGWAPQSALPGDRVYILRGCRIPFVFRLNPEEGLHLIGGAYIHGLMDYEPGVLAQGKFEKMEIV